MVKGGYQIINLDGVIHTLGLGMLHEGIYERIENTQKTIMVSGINIGGFDYHDCYVEPKVNGSNYEFEMYGYNVTINDVDVVTVVKAPSTSIETIEFDNDFNDLNEYEPPIEDYNKFRSCLSNIPFKVKYRYSGREKESLIISVDIGDYSGYGLTDNSAFYMRASDNRISYGK